MDEVLYSCPVCRLETQLIYQLQLLVKDDSTLSTKNIYRLLLYTQNGKGKEFFGGRKPKNLYQSKRDLNILEEYYNLLVKFHVYLDLVIERLDVNPDAYYQIIDGQVSFKHLKLEAICDNQ